MRGSDRDVWRVWRNWGGGGYARAEDICGLVRDNFQKELRGCLEVNLRFLRDYHLGTRLCALGDVVVNPDEVGTRLRLSTLGAGLLATRKPVGTTHVAADVPASRQV